MGVSPFKDSKGRTRYRVTLSRNGRRLVDERLPAGTSKDKAEAYCARITSQWFDRDRLGIQEIPLIAEVIREYERRIMPSLRSPSFAKDCIRAAAPYVVGHTVNELPECAKALHNGLRASLTTIVHRLRFLRTLAHYAVKWGMVDRDYGVTMQIPTLDNVRHFYPRKAEVAKILRHMSKPMRWACWQLYYTGMRRGELWSAQIKGGCYVNHTTKNRQPKVTPIIAPLRKIAGKPTMTRDALSKRFKIAAQKAGFPYRLHDLRHGHASMLLEAGAPLNVIAEVLGHKDLKSTRKYAHLQTQSKAEWMSLAAKMPRKFTATGPQAPDNMGKPTGMPPATGKKKAA